MTLEARPDPKPWVTNALTGEKVSSDIDWLITRLAALNPAANDRPDVVDYHAHQIRGHWLTWRWRGDITGVEVRGTQRPYARRVAAKGSTTKELKRLRTAAKGSSDKVWQKSWLATSGKTYRLIGWRPHGSGGFEISLPRTHRVMPTRADALPLIEAALRKHEAVPRAERQRRRRDALADDVVRAVAVAYRDLTGQRGLFWDDVRGGYRGGLLDLAGEIEAYFGGARLFTVRRINFIFEMLEN